MKAHPPVQPRSFGYFPLRLVKILAKKALSLPVWVRFSASSVYCDKNPLIAARPLKIMRKIHPTLKENCPYISLKALQKSPISKGWEETFFTVTNSQNRTEARKKAKLKIFMNDSMKAWNVLTFSFMGSVEEIKQIATFPPCTVIVIFAGSKNMVNKPKSC